MALKELEVFDKDCPYRCSKGILFHPRSHQESVCPHCSKLRKDVVYSTDISKDKESVETLLGLQERVVGKAEYSFEALFREGLDKFESASLNSVKSDLDKLVSDLSLGDLPKYSMLFNLGSRVFEENFTNPLLVRAYLAGLKVAPLLTVHTIAKLRRSVESQDYATEDLMEKYTMFLEADICVVVLDEGITKSGIDLVQGFVYARGRDRKPTVLLTHSSVSDILYNFATDGDYFDYSVPKLIQVKYKKKSDGAPQGLPNDSVDVSSTPQYSKSSFSALSSNRQFL